MLDQRRWRWCRRCINVIQTFCVRWDELKLYRFYISAHLNYIENKPLLIGARYWQILIFPGGGISNFKEMKCFFPAHLQRFNIVGSLRDRACSISNRQGSDFEFCVWRAVPSHSSHHPQEVILVQFSLYVHKDGLKPHSFYFIFLIFPICFEMDLDLCRIIDFLMWINYYLSHCGCCTKRWQTQYL